jgi:hypothetical protein
MPKLLPREPLRRELKQHVAFTDPVTKQKVEILFATVHEGEHEGCPVIEIAGRLVMWELPELAFEAVKILREEGVLVSGEAKHVKEELERIEKGETWFSPVSDEEKQMRSADAFTKALFDSVNIEDAVIVEEDKDDDTKEK